MRERNIKFQVWLYPGEADRLDQMATMTNMSKSAYIRNLISGYEPKVAPPLDYFKVVGELRRIGNNTNQIAKNTNKWGDTDYEEYRQNHLELTMLTDELAKVFLPKSMG